jgi:hypothetical protein
MRHSRLRNLVTFATIALLLACVAHSAPQTAAGIVVSYVDANGNAFVVSPGATITFVPTAVGTTAVVTVDISNPQTQSVGVNSVAVSGAGFQLSGAPLPGSTIAAGGDVRFTVQFTSQQTGSASGSLNINAGTQNLSFSIAAQVVVPTSNVVVTYIDANGNAVMLVQGSTITFPATPVGTPAVVTVDIANRGAQSAVVNTVAVSGTGFQISGVPLPGSVLAAGSDLRFTIQFNPTQIGSASGSLNVNVGTQNLSVPLSAQTAGPAFTYQLQIGKTTAALLSGQTITIPNTAVGATGSATVTIQNSGNTTGTIDNITVTGTVFQLGAAPALPLTLAAGATQTLTITFAPAQAGPATGQLTIGSDSFGLGSSGLGPTLSFTYSVAGTDMPLSSTNGTITFVQVAVGGTQSTTVKVLNTGTAQALITNIGINGSGSVFSVSGLPALPLNLNPGAGTSFSVTFSPTATGTATGTLLVNASAFNLIGSATAPPVLSNVTFSGASGTTQPLAQPTVGLALESPYPLDLNGSLTLQFNSAVFSDDPSIQFSNGSRTIAFTIPANTTTAVFPDNAQQAQFQTGSVAGTISLTASFATDSGLAVVPPSTPTQTLTVPQLAPQIVGIEVSSTSSTGFNLSITGLATGRQVNQIAVQFTPVSGLTLSIPTANVDVSGTFDTWYLSTSSQAYGSMFTATIPFSLQGKVGGYANLIDAIQSVSVTVSNTQGTSSAQTVSLQ